MQRTFVLISITLAASIASPVSAGPTSAECISSHEQALHLKNSRRLRETLPVLLQCASESCPVEIRTECAEQLASFRARVPTVVFSAKDPNGNDLKAVRVSMDGVLLVDELDGSALEVDPGEHTFRFEARGFVAVDKKLIIAEGAKNRHEQVALVSTSPAPTSSQPPAAEDDPGAGRRAAGIVVGAVGIVGIGLGAVFGLRASSKWDDAKSACGAGCGADAPAQRDKEEAETAATVSTVAFAAGGTALAAGVVIFLTAPKRSASPKSALRVTPAFGPSSASLSVGGRFR